MRTLIKVNVYTFTFFIFKELLSILYLQLFYIKKLSLLGGAFMKVELKEKFKTEVKSNLMKKGIKNSVYTTKKIVNSSIVIDDLDDKSSEYFDDEIVNKKIRELGLREIKAKIINGKAKKNEYYSYNKGISESIIRKTKDVVYNIINVGKKF